MTAIPSRAAHPELDLWREPVLPPETRILNTFERLSRFWYRPKRASRSVLFGFSDVVLLPLLTRASKPSPAA